MTAHVFRSGQCIRVKDGVLAPDQPPDREPCRLGGGPQRGADRVDGAASSGRAWERGPSGGKPAVLTDPFASRAPVLSAKPQIELIRRDRPKVGPNAPCPYGSGKKYEKCCART